MKFRAKQLYAVVLAVLAIIHVLVICFNPEGVRASVFSVLPIFTTILLAVISREVFSSLFLGAVSSAFLMSASSKGIDIIADAFVTIVGGDERGVGLLNVLSDPWNVGIVIFFMLISIIADFMNKSGGCHALAEFTKRHVKSRMGTQLVTVVFGCIMFVDDYFNCLTVGNVMRPLTDTHKISRAKLAYIVDSTASPICMLIPLSSWVAAVSGYVSTSEINGIDLFFKQIPYNYYCLLTIVMLLVLPIMNLDFGPMQQHEYNAQVNNDIFTVPNSYIEAERQEVTNKNGIVLDLLIPLILLIIFSLLGILYTGGIFKESSFLEAFAAADAARGLAFGACAALLISILYYTVFRKMRAKKAMDIIPEGIKYMATPVTILILAWLLGNITRTGLGTAEFFSSFIQSIHFDFMPKFLPAIIFLMCAFIGFATGTSWGTISIMAPITVQLFDYATNPELCVLGITAVCAGAVSGDHTSPISDTSIMASTGAHCDLMTHITTQLPYAATVIGVSFMGFLLAGFVQSPFISLFMTVTLLIAVLSVIKALSSLKYPGRFEEMAQADH